MTLKIANLTLFTVLSAVLVSCAAPPPIEEYTLARTAKQAARAAESGRHASGFWYKAEEHYRKGEKAYKNGDFAQAKIDLDLAKQYAEKAENVTRLKKFQSGELAP